jgi:methylphosphotriester-DNA--protein-cysteine methyltransferase
VPLDDLWDRELVDHVRAVLDESSPAQGLTALRDAVLMRGAAPPDLVDHAVRVIERRAGRVEIDKLARQYDLTRQQFARRFGAAAGMSPKQFARVKRFHALVHALLSTDVSKWAAMSTEIGFYDQAHMINEFRSFTGSPPTVFFQPHGLDGNPMKHQQLRGRPSEWLCPNW